MVEKFEGVFVGELDDGILERADLLEHLVCYLRVQTNSTMLELVKWWIKRLINADELFLESFEFALVLKLRFFQSSKFILKLSQISLSPLYILFALH